MYQPKAKHLVMILLIGLALCLGTSQSYAIGWGHGWGWGGWGWDCCGGGWSGWGGGWGGWGWSGCCEPWGGSYGWYRGYGCGYGCGWGGRLVGWRRGYAGCCGGWDAGCNDCGAVVEAPCCGAGVAPAYNASPAPGGQPKLAPPRPEPTTPTPTLPPANMPTAPATPTPPTPAPPAAGTSTESFPSRATSGVLTVLVPADAKVTVNGLLTRSTGTRREYISYNLQPGMTYRYTVVAQVVRDGKVLQDTRVVTLSAGSRDGVAFNFAATADQQLAQTF